MNIIIKNVYNLSIVKNKFFIKIFKYSIVGTICTIIDFILLFILSKYCGLNYLTSSIISFMSGAVLNYFLCISWIFEIRIIKKTYQEFFYYLIITGVGLGINTILIWVITEFFGLYFMLSKIFAILVTFWWNFSARKYFLHSIKQY